MSGATHSGDPITRNAFFALASQAATARFAAGITVFLVRGLDRSDCEL